MLKEKQDHEERTSNTGVSPSLLSPSPCSVKSPPPIQEVQASEVIGAGLPLLQRLLLLKAKEDHQATVVQHPPTSPTDPAALASTSSTHSIVTPSSGNQRNFLSISTQGKPKISFKDRLKFHKDDVGSVKDGETCQHAGTGNVDRLGSEPPWSKLKKAAIVRDPSNLEPTGGHTSTLMGSKGDDKCEERVVPRTRSLKLTRKTKQYCSIDDLSPEYGGLPFVKKLKILNERQKLEELESVMKTRSFSLDIPEFSQPQIEVDSLTRSQSEGSTMHQHRSHHHQDDHLLTTQFLVPSSLNSSSESNETPERRNLKSILKKLTEDTQLPTLVPNKIGSGELRKLMRAPTIEGYAARHSKLSKSVTFNRNTLQSPPNSANLLNGSQNLFPFVNDSSVMEDTAEDNGTVIDQNTKDHEKEDTMRQEVEKYSLKLITSKSNQVKLLKGNIPLGDISIAKTCSVATCVVRLTPPQNPNSTTFTQFFRVNVQQQM